MLISFIIPLYNCGPYIARCLDSILAQNIDSHDYEVIVVNDGSTDKGEEIAQQYADKYSNFHILHQKNQGAGIARNSGKSKACGKYIFFLDADDTISLGGLTYILNIIQEKSPEIITFEIQHVYDMSNRSINNPQIFFDGTLLDYAQKYGIRPTCTDNIYHKDIIDGINFNTMPIGEDMHFMVRLFSKYPTCRTISTNARIYCYYMRSSSLMHTTNTRFITNVINGYIHFYKMIIADGSLCNYPKEVVEKFVMNHIQGVILTKMFSPGFSRRILNEIREKCLECGIFPINNCPNRTISFLYWLANHPSVGYLFSFPFRYIYLKYVK